MPYSILGAIDQLEMLNGAICDNPCVILTLDNILMFCDNVTLPDSWDTTQAFAEIPIEFGVLGNRSLSVVTETADGAKCSILRIDDNLVYIDTPGTLVHTNSICVSFSGDWYTNELDNNKSQGTSELTEI